MDARAGGVVSASTNGSGPLVELERGHRVACFNPVPEDAWTRELAAS